MNNAKQVYEIQLMELLTTAKHSKVKDKPAMMHAFCEVAAQVARESGFGFEDFAECATCAWHCAMERINSESN